MSQPGEPTDRIRLSGITARGRHGVFEHERRDGQTFRADVVLHVDTRPAAAEDRLDLTVDYGVVAGQVADVLAGEPADLLETVAERIAALALTHRAVMAVDVVVHKPEAPVPVAVSDVTVEISRDRVRTPVVSPVSPTDTQPPGAPTAPQPEPGVSGHHDPLDAVPVVPADVVLALGSNVGPSRTTLRGVVRELGQVDGLEITAVAPLARTAPVGGPVQPDYLNTVVLGRTTLSPRALLAACQSLEAAHGRIRDEIWGPRTLDIDIVAHGTTVAAGPDLELPHPGAHARAFVLEPWAQVDPEAVLPGPRGGPVASLAQTAPDRAGIRWMAPDWWHDPQGSG